MKYVLTAIGPDRPGIVARLAGFLTGQGYNLEDSRMAVLGGEFAVLLLVSRQAENAPPLTDLVTAIEDLTGMTVTAKASTAVPGTPAGVPYLVHGYAMDHPGIVYVLSNELASLGANIEEMETSMRPAPITGTPLFDVNMRISLPVGVSVSQLRRQLQEVGDARNIDVSVESWPVGN